MVTNYVDATKVRGNLSSAVVPANKVDGILSNANINAARVNNLATVATSGQYRDLLGKPVLAAVATGGNIDASKMIPSGALANKLSGPIYGVEVYLASMICKGRTPDLAIPAIASPYPMDYVFASVLCQKLSYTTYDYIKQFNYISFIQPDAVNGDSQCYVHANEDLSGLVELCTYFVFNDIPSA